ncbi:MAG TPA: ABC transporter substrate-binding protein, partial [Thermococcus litoralis]|nr:ABC transporter substrate-binding protein [Thermococcus litoralis]
MKKIATLLFTLILLSPLTLAQEKPLVVTSISPIAEILKEAFG